MLLRAPAFNRPRSRHGLQMIRQASPHAADSLTQILLTASTVSCFNQAAEQLAQLDADRLSKILSVRLSDLHAELRSSPAAWEANAAPISLLPVVYDWQARILFAQFSPRERAGTYQVISAFDDARDDPAAAAWTDLPMRSGDEVVQFDGAKFFSVLFQRQIPVPRREAYLNMFAHMVIQESPWRRPDWGQAFITFLHDPLVRDRIARLRMISAIASKMDSGYLGEMADSLIERIHPLEQTLLRAFYTYRIIFTAPQSAQQYFREAVQQMLGAPSRDGEQLVAMMVHAPQELSYAQDQLARLVGILNSTEYAKLLFTVCGSPPDFHYPVFNHQAAVENSLIAGKPVPFEVIALYPALFEKYAP